MSDYSELIGRLFKDAKTLEDVICNQDADYGEIDLEIVGNMREAAAALKLVVTLEQTVSDYADMIDKLKEGISFIQLHQSKRARK